MYVSSVRVEHFRSIALETLACDQLTALVGANGAGKSSMLRAIELFYLPTPRVEIEDFYDRDTTKAITVSLTFAGLSVAARELFASYMQGDLLTVDRVFTYDNGRVSAKYHGASLQNPDFATVRAAVSAKEKRQAYETLRTQPPYGSLPPWKSQNETPAALTLWEAENPTKCARQRDDGQFFGFNEVAQGRLGRFTRLLFIPAVRDAGGDSTEGKGSAITQLMDLVVRSVLASTDAISKLTTETQQRYRDIVGGDNITALSSLATRLTDTLNAFAPGASVQLHWLPLQAIDLPTPKADVKLVEDGYEAPVVRCGHGLQRAFILTMLQHLTVAQEQSAPKAGDVGATETVLPDLLLIVEEPELYQHPNRQRHLARLLLALATGAVPGVADKTQVIYAVRPTARRAPASG